MIHPFNSVIISEDKHKLIPDEVVEHNIHTKTNLKPIDYSMYSECQYKGTTYKTKLYLSKFTNNVMFIFEIKAIIFTKDNQILILAKQIALKDFSTHYQAYEVPDELQIIDEFAVVNINEFSGPPVNITSTSTYKAFVRLKEFF